MRTQTENEIENLKILLKRKAELEENNDSNYKGQYQVILKDIIALEKKLQLKFSKENYDNILEKKVLPFGPGNLSQKQIESLNSNYDLSIKYHQKLEEIQRLYNERKSITEFEKAANEYIKIWMQIKR